MSLQCSCVSEPNLIQFPILGLYVTKIDSVLDVENNRNNELKTGRYSRTSM